MHRKQKIRNCKYFYLSNCKKRKFKFIIVLSQIYIKFIVNKHNYHNKIINCIKYVLLAISGTSRKLQNCRLHYFKTGCRNVAGWWKVGGCIIAWCILIIIVIVELGHQWCFRWCIVKNHWITTRAVSSSLCLEIH